MTLFSFEHSESALKKAFDTVDHNTKTSLLWCVKVISNKWLAS